MLYIENKVIMSFPGELFSKVFLPAKQTIILVMKITWQSFTKVRYFKDAQYVQIYTQFKDLTDRGNLRFLQPVGSGAGADLEADLLTDAQQAHVTVTVTNNEVA